MRVKTVSLKNVCLLCACSVSVLDEAAPTAVLPERPPPRRGASPASTRSTGAVARGRCHGYHPFARPTTRGGSEVSRALAREEAAAGAGRGWFSGAVRAAWEHRGGRGIREKRGSLGADLRGGGATLLCGWLAGGKPGKMRSLVYDWERGGLLKHRPSVSSLQA